MPDFKKRLVVVDQDQPTSLVPKKSVQQQNQETEQLLTNLQKKVQTGAASKEEIGLYNQNIQMATNFMKEVDNIRANADNYAPRLTKLFNEDLGGLGFNFDLVKKNMFSPNSVPGQQEYYIEQNKDLIANQFNKAKNNFRSEGTKKLAQAETFLKNNDAAGLRSIAEYFNGPRQETTYSSPLGGDNTDRVFYNKETFNKTGRKTANYLLNLARLIDTSNMISNPNDFRTPEVRNTINQNNRVADVLNNPGYLKTIGRQLMAQEIGSKLYGKDQLFIHETESVDRPDNNIDFEATQLAADAIKNLATFEYRKKLAEYTRLKKFAQESGNKVDIEKAENALKQSESILNNTEAFDMDKFLKTNYRQTYLQQKEEEEDAKKRREGVDYWLKGSPLGKAAFDYIPIDPVKMHYSISSGLKSIYNNYIDLAAGISNIGASDFEKAQNIYTANKITYDKTGYTIGVDEGGNPVDSSQFRWTDPKGKTHYNGYAIIESGLPVAEQMLETILLSEVGGGLISGLRGAVAGAGRTLLGAERVALLGEKALATPVLGQITKAVTNPEVYNRLRTFGSVYATTYPRIYAEEYNNFKNPEDVTNVAKMRSVVESLTESIIPNTPDLFKKGAGGLFALGKKEYARDLAAGIDGVVLGMFPGASNKVVRALGESATFKRAVGMGKDIFQEAVVEEEASLLGNHFVDKYAKSKNKDYVEQNELTLKNIISTAVESAAAMLLTAPFMGGGTRRNDNQSIIAARWNIANDPELYKSVTASQLKAGEITQEQAVQKIAKIDQYSKALETLPIKNLSSIRDMKTLLENKDAQYDFFSKHLEREALLEYVPTDEELPEYTKQLETLDADLYKTQQLADKYDALSIEDKKKIIYDNFKSKLNNLITSDDVSPAAVSAALAQAGTDYKKNKNRLFSTELEGHINDLEAAMDGVKGKFISFIANNNEGLTSEQRNYKVQLLGLNSKFFETEEVDKMLDVLQKAEVSAYAPLFEIQDENDFIEALARNYVTAKTNERPLTADGKLLYNQIEDQYVNDGLFQRFVSKLPEDEALAKKEELKQRFWSRVVELKQKQEPGQVFPEVGIAPITEEEKFDAAAAETTSKYKNLIANYRVAVERDLTEDQQVIREETIDGLVAEESVEDLVKGLASVQSIFIGDNLKKIAQEVQEGKTDKLVEFLEENGATKKQIEKLLNKIGKPAEETKAEDKAEAKETVKVEEVLAGKTKAQIEADLKAKKEEIEKKRKATLEDNKYNKPYTEKDFTDFNEEVNQDLLGKYQFDLNSDSLEEQDLIIVNTFQEGIDKINAKYDAELAKVLQQEVEQLGSMMFDFTPEEQRILREYASEAVPVVETAKIDDIYKIVPEPLKETAEDGANESQEKLNQEAQDLQPIEDIRENYVYLGITDTSYDNKTRLTDENVALVFSVIDRIEESVNSKDIRSLGYNLLMHSAREVFNRVGLNIQPKPTIEEFTEQFRVNGILVLPKNQIDYLFKFPNTINQVKLGIITNEKGEPLFFDRLGQKVTTGTPIITSIGQTFEKEEGKGGKTLDEKFKQTISEDGQIAPLSLFVNGRKIVYKPISVKETDNLIIHATEKQSVSVGGKTFFLFKGVVYLKTENPDFPYRATYTKYNTKESAEEIVTLVEAYNAAKLNPEESTLPDYFKSMTPNELIEYIHNYAFIPKNSSKHDWGITPVTRVGETEARFLNIYKKTGATPEERKNSRSNPIPREEAVNLVAKTSGSVSKKYFDGDIEFRPFKIEGGKVKIEKATNFKAWFGDFRKSGARIDGVANRNLAFAKQDVKPLTQPLALPLVEAKTATEVVIESVLPEVTATEASVSDKKAATEKELFSETDSKGRTYTFFSNTKEKEGRITTTFSFNRSDKDLSQRNNATSGIPVEKALGDKYTINEDSIPEGAKVVGVSEIRITEKGAGATVTLENEGQRYQAEVLLNSNTTYDAELTALTETPVFDTRRKSVLLKKADLSKAPEFAQKNVASIVEAINENIRLQVVEKAYLGITATFIAKELGLTTEQVRSIRTYYGVPDISDKEDYQNWKKNINAELAALTETKPAAPVSTQKIGPGTSVKINTSTTSFNVSLKTFKQSGDTIELSYVNNYNVQIGYRGKLKEGILYPTESFNPKSGWKPKSTATFISIELPTQVPVISEEGKLPNDIKEEFKGKFIYATPGAGKTTLAQGMQGVVDTDVLMIEEMKKRHPEFFAEAGESIQNFIYRYASSFNEKADIDKVVLNQAKELASQGYTVLTGTIAFIKDADIVITAPTTLERVAERFKNAQAAETFSNKEAEEIRKADKTAQPINNFLEYYLTNKGFVDPVDPSDVPPPVPTRRGRRGSDDQYTLLRSKIYANQITQAQNEVAKRWVETVGKKAFGADRFIIEKFLTNPKAWATWSEAGMRLFADANFAELYHESWHEFTQMFFTPEQREALYKEAKKIYGKLGQEELEEKIAEDFRQFMLTGVMPESIQKYKNSRTLFQKLADFLKNFFTNKKTVDKYFEKLSLGKVGKKVGRPEFKTLNSAKSLSLHDNNDNLINLSFEESKRYLDMIDELFVMLGNYKVTKNKEDEQGLSYLNIMYSPENIKRMYDDIFDYFVYLEDQADSVKDLAAQKELARIFGLGNKNIDRILDYHLLNSPLFTKEMVSEVEELEEEELSDTNILKDELGKKSQLELADTLVVNIIRTIPMVDSKGFMILNPLTDAPVFGDFTENWNILKNTLSGSTSYPEMLTRIEKLSEEYPQFGYLLAQLPKKITLDSAQQLRNLFFNTMSQEKVEGVQGNFNTEGKYNVSNTGTLDVKRVRDLWSLKFNTEKEGKYKIPSSVTNNFVLDPRIFEVYPEEPKSPEDVLDFLNGIGFNYSQKAQQAFIKDFNQLRTRFHYVYDKLKDVVLNSGTEVSDPFLAIREGHVDQKTGSTIKGKSYDLDRLVELESKHNLSFANDMIQTADGSSQFITNPPTYQTKVVAALNDPKYKYFEDLFVDFPELDPSLNWGLVNSAYLDYLFDFTTDTLVDGKVKHKRRTKDGEPVSLEVVTLNGVTSEEDYGFNEKTINLEDPEKHLGDVRTLLSSYGRVEENNRIGDKSTTRGLVLSNENYFLYNRDSYFREGKFNPKPQIWNIIYKYLEAEARITDKKSIYDVFNTNKFFEGIPQLAYFSEILSPDLRTQVYEFFKNNTIEDFESSPLEKLVQRSITVWINTSANESQNLLSKFERYKIKGKKTEFQVTLDELKRYHTLSMIHRIEQYKLFNYHPYYYKNAKDVEKRIGAFNASGTFSVTDRENLEYTQASLTMQKAFNDYADKIGIEPLPRKGGLEDVTYLVAEDERLDSQTARENKEDYGIHYNSYAETKKKVDVQDAASLFTLDFFRKFHATSKGLSSNMKKEMDRQASIWANLLEIKSNSSNTEARDNMNKLLNEGPYFIFSVEKLQYAGPGKTPAELVPLFHKYSNKILLPSEMVDNEELFNIAVKLHASNADYLVFKTGTKIAETVKPVSLFSNGKVDSSAQDTGVLSLAYLKEQQEIKHKEDQLIIFATQFRKLLFKDVTTSEEKNLLKVYKAYIKELTGYDVDNYLAKIQDKKAAVEFLVKELDKKNVSAITKDLIRVKETNGELEYAVDSIIERTLAESAIASSIRKSIIRQKFNGTQFVQFPVSLVRPDRKLKFYRMKDGKIASAEAIISFSKQYHSLLDLPFDDKTTIGKFDKDGNIINRYEALKRLNQKLADDAFREKYKDSLTLAGVRIPVQGYNSMEKMEIVEFLPEESGQMILVPDELVVKSGGDFDIDKLFMYEPKLQNGLMLTEENSTDVEKQKRSIIQNKLLNVIKDRLSQKEIFLDLIEPNNVKDLDEFAKRAPEYLSGDTNKIIKDSSGRDMWTNLINPHYQLYVYQLAQAMGMVGVAAKANTFQAAAQDAKLEIVDESQIDLIYLDTNKNSEGHIQLWKIYDVDNNNKISQIISQIISGAVDIVKNDNILKNNINPNTVSVALYLNMMGVRYADINALLRDELVYRLSKGESFQDILRNSFREQYDYYGTFKMNGGFSNYGTAKAILNEFNKEDLLTDKSPAGSLARLAQFVILQSQQNNYITPLLLNSDFDTQSFQNFEAVLRKEKAIQKVYADKFFNTEGITGVIYNSVVSPFKIDSSFIKNFEDIFPISANKGLTNYIVDFYGELENPWIDYENFSRRFKNGLLTSILETNMSEFEQYAQYLKVDPTIKNLQDMASEIKKEAAENGAYIPLLDSINFSGDINSDYIAPGIYRNDNNLDVDIKKEQFKNNLTWDIFREQEVSQEFRNKVRDFFRIFAYAGIISTQLSKTHSSFLEIIPEEIYTPVVDRFVKATAADISKGSKSEYLNTFRRRFVYNNPDIFNFTSFDKIPNPSLRFFRNYNLNIPQEQLEKDYLNLVPRVKENVPSTPLFPNNINPDVKLPETQIVEDIKQVEKEEATQLAEESIGYESLQQELEILRKQLNELREQEKEVNEFSPPLIVANNLPKITLESAEKETGGKVGLGDQDINYSLTSKTGISVERAAEQISENILNGVDYVKVEYSDVFNYIVDILFMGKGNFIAKYSPYAAQKQELAKRIAALKEQIKQQPKEKTRKKFKPVEKIPGQLDLFANKEQIDQLTNENTSLINDIFSDDNPVDQSIIDQLNNLSDDESICPLLS